MAASQASRSGQAASSRSMAANGSSSGSMKIRPMALMTSTRAREAFDLSREPRRLRERYGMHAWGQRALLASAGTTLMAQAEDFTPGSFLGFLLNNLAHVKRVMGQARPPDVTQALGLYE